MFAGITFIGFLLSFGIRGNNLEEEGWDTEQEDEEGDEEYDAQGHDDANERTGLIGGR